MNDTITAIYFDLGKVLFDFDFDYLFARVPKALAEEPSRVTDAGALANRLEVGEIDENTFLFELINIFPELETPENACHAWCDVFTPIKENIAIVRQLAETNRFRLGVISNTNEPHMRHLRGLSNVFDCFDHLALSHEVRCMKPSAGIFENALQGLKATAGRALFFDDREENVLAAQNLGFNATHVTEPGIVFDELSLRHLI